MMLDDVTVISMFTVRSDSRAEMAEVVLIQVMGCHRADMMNARTLIFTAWISTDEKGFSCDNRTKITKPAFTPAHLQVCTSYCVCMCVWPHLGVCNEYVVGGDRELTQTNCLMIRTSGV